MTSKVIALSSPQESSATTPAPTAQSEPAMQLARMEQHQPAKALLATVQAATSSSLARGNADARMMLADVSVGLTRPKALESPKIFQLARREGPETVVKLLVVVLKSFVDSVKVPEKMDAAEIIDLAGDLAELYSHDSVMDIVLALKEGRMGGFKFYQSIDATKICKLISSYFERKADWLQDFNLDQKEQTMSNQKVAIDALGKVAPNMISSMALRLPPTHPAHDLLRRKLTITKGKHERGLIDDEEAERQREEVKKVLGNGRRNYDPKPRD